MSPDAALTTQPRKVSALSAHRDVHKAAVFSWKLHSHSGFFDATLGGLTFCSPARIMAHTHSSLSDFLYVETHTNANAVPN